MIDQIRRNILATGAAATAMAAAPQVFACLNGLLVRADQRKRALLEGPSSREKVEEYFFDRMNSAHFVTMHAGEEDDPRAALVLLDPYDVSNRLVFMDKH